MKWLLDERLLNFWEGKSSVFDLDRIIKEFYSEEKFEITRAIIEYNGKSIGYVQMYKLDEDMLNEYEYPLTDKVVYGIDQFIGEPEYWGKGIGTYFMKLVLNYLTKEKNAHSDNLRAIRCYEKVGFKKIKFLPKHKLHDGEMVDCYLMEYTSHKNIPQTRIPTFPADKTKLNKSAIDLITPVFIINNIFWHYNFFCNISFHKFPIFCFLNNLQ